MATFLPRYTLLIPTYSRHAYLRSQLAYLAARRFEFPIRVLDSSPEPVLSENRALISQSGLNIMHQVYDSSMAVWTKLALGIAGVETPYSSLCPDDDIVFTGALHDCLDFLESNPAFVAVHGYYINFKPGEIYDISHVVYSAPSISAGDALARVVQQMSDYQAIFYAVHRTNVMQSVLSQLAPVQSILTQELLSSSLTVIAGKVSRLPLFYMARNTNPSIESLGWHPYQYLATKPASLFLEYAPYRAVLLERLLADQQCQAMYRPVQLERIVDLAHLKYLAPMIAPRVIDYVLAESQRSDREPHDIVRGMWREFANPGDNTGASARGLLGHARRALSEPAYALRLLKYGARLFRLLGELRFQESLNASVARSLDKIQFDHQTRDGRPRRYALFRDFINHDLPGGQHIIGSHVRTILDYFADYY